MAAAVAALVMGSTAEAQRIREPKNFTTHYLSPARETLVTALKDCLIAEAFRVGKTTSEPASEILPVLIEGKTFCVDQKKAFTNFWLDRSREDHPKDADEYVYDTIVFATSDVEGTTSRFAPDMRTAILSARMTK